MKRRRQSPASEENEEASSIAFIGGRLRRTVNRLHRRKMKRRCQSPSLEEYEEVVSIAFIGGR
ncbi:hypothetical protein KY289_023395 [Solanum tuberosum]|nr:hypothetical protein KY289_023395 [Solanum tuberosum]